MSDTNDLIKASGLQPYQPSISQAGGATYFLGRSKDGKFVAAFGPAGSIHIQGKQTTVGDSVVVVGPMDHANAKAIRQLLPWTAPVCLHLATSAGLGDRLGLATPGHIRSIRGSGLAVILAQQSIREMTRTQRTPDEVMDCATWGVFQEGFRDGFGSDADHLQKPEDIDATLAAGFTMFTIDPGAHVDDAADTADAASIAGKMAGVDFATLQSSPAEMAGRYVGKKFALEGLNVQMTQEQLDRALVKYGNAVAHTVKMFRHLAASAKGQYELEVSVDETACPTTPEEHYFFASELKRLGVKWVSMAPRFVGRFEKGVDYIGDKEEFRRSFAQHVAVMKALGPYKISIHSGSDKFSIYPIIAEVAGPYVHLKTAGTSYLEAIRSIAAIDPGLFREILDFAHQRYETDKASYHVSADPAKVPQAAALKDDQLAAVLDLFDGRQLLHVTFGSVLTARDSAGASRFRQRILAALAADEEHHYDVVERHIRRHIEPFIKCARS